MSAELYDAEMAGALARPAIDVLPSHHARKDKGAEGAAEAAPAVDSLEATLEPVPDSAPAEPTVDAFEALLQVALGSVGAGAAEHREHRLPQDQ